ncbi:ImmA/IrrE family metallo-endopeptidase [Bacillus sp. UNCCL81]|uniref:ImmA/IrrE family metallo-endopeptidase n=1 Tax=Bacillus sp. UNCCL81 TaxID=1502755 RepID=UPI0003F9A797|nr:ImmA/IrrE family metallo-endopeptidase [Bacillus sp. UNCCL81]SFD60527.1 Zn-dependent peptidase ImmA, M78 family [Bacillus sp. UNCCL81]
MLTEEQYQRTKIKQYADTVRYSWSQKGITDVIDILEELAIVIKTPYQNKDEELLSGFSTYIRKHFVVFINTAYTGGHQRFTAAHELYHLIYDTEVLKREVILPKETNNEKLANWFAVEFLMPEEGIIEYVHSRFQRPIQPKHIIRLHQHFKVSYKAMLKRILQLNLIEKDEYDYLERFCSNEQEYIDKLLQLTTNEGLDIKLIQSTFEKNIPKRYLDVIRDNYEQGLISYHKFSSLLNLADKSPIDYGYNAPEEEVY